MKIPCFVAPVRVPGGNRGVPERQIDIPARQVQCHCPRACWVAESTLKACDEAGGKPTYYCPTCCPDDVRGSIQAISADVKARLAAGDPAIDPTQPVAGLIHGVRNYNYEED